MEPLKEMFNAEFYKQLAKAFKKSYPAFNDKKFIAEVSKNLSERSLNERMRHTSLVLKEFLPADYKQTVSILKETIQQSKTGYTSLLFPDYVALYGLHDFKTSLDALKYFTRFGSSEFAIRHFLKADFNHTLKVMYTWSEDENHHVRRLSSEGSRPRLPWSFKLDEVIKKPELTAPILTNLKADIELYVRKSVANHLNDISKENAGYMLRLISDWDKNHPHTAWIIKHASRTLIKKGDGAAMQVFDFEKNAKLKIEKLKLAKTKLKLGETLEFEFEIISEKNKTQKLVVDYIIHYQKKLGGTSPKVFKLKEIDLAARQKVKLSKKQVLKDFTTRKHFAGKHRLEIQVNGRVCAGLDFDLAVY